MKIAIVHDWLTVYAGAERVLEQILQCYPEAEIFSMVDFLEGGQRNFLQGKSVKTSIIQKLPFARSKYRSYLPLMPIAVEQFDMSAYDIVISSSYAVAKGVIVGPDQLHVCLCYSPIRYAWDLQHQYLKESNLDKGLKSWLVRKMLHNIRIWDSRTANGVDKFVAISNFISRRIEKAYRRDSVVIYPSVQVEDFLLKDKKDDFYLTASRMVPYKKISLIVEAFNQLPDKRLIVIGDGPDFTKIKAVAGPNITLMGHQSFLVLKDYLQRARAFVFAAEEDFGIAPLEAQACGTPVIAYGKGGVRETIYGLTAQKPTGVLYDTQDVASLKEAVLTYEKESDKITSLACRENALRFSPERFRNEFKGFVESSWAEFRKTWVDVSGSDD